MELDILFLGRLFPKEKEAEIKRKMRTGMQDAANALQWNIIDGLEDNGCGKIKILNYLPVNSYPKGYEDKKIEEFVFQHTDKYKADDLNVGCTNRSIIKQITNIVPFKAEIRKWVRQRSKRKKILMIYTASLMFLKLAKEVKRLDPGIDVCCIIADIPEFATASDLKGIRKIYNIYGTKRSNMLFKYIDKFVLLTEQMAQKLNIRVPFTVVEGIASESRTVEGVGSQNALKGQKYILYSGTLNYKFGIKELLDAFSMISNDDVKLVVCGFGQAESMIRERQKDDNRIVFWGRIDREDVIGLQKEAAVLVNPRQNNEEFTKYSFPSKTMEYLASGVPLVAYKLDGIPDEYDEYIHYVPDNSPETLAAVLQRVCEEPEEARRAFAARGKAFVLAEKNRVAQTKKILELINQL